MSALYGMKVVLAAGPGLGALYIGKGLVLGADVTGARYKATYTEQGGRVKFTGTMSIPPGATIFGGEKLAQGAEFPMSADLPKNFADGSVQQVTVAGRTVQATFEKIGDIP